MAIGLFGAILPAGTAAAQGGGFAPQGPGLEWGPVLVRPTFIINYGADDNIFYSSDDLTGSEPVASRETQLQPGIRFECPFGQSYIRGGYSALYRNYSTEEYTPSTQWSHYFDLDGHIRTGARVYFNVRDRFVRGTEELREVDPGGELTFGDIPFRNHSPSVEAGVDLSPRQAISVVWNYNSSQFSETEEGDTFFNYRGHGLQARYNYKLRPETTGYLYVASDTMSQVRTDDRVEYEGHGVGLGLVQVLNRVMTTSLVVGYQAMDSSGLVESAYHGPTMNANASWLVGDGTRLTLTVRRVPYQSFFLNNAYYLNRSVLFEVLNQVGVTSFWRLGGGFEQNVYSDPLDVTGLEPVYCSDDGSGGSVCPSAGVRRRDTGWRAEGGFGAQFSRTARWFVGYTWQSRTSNLLQADQQGGFGDPFSYDINRYFFRIEVGWL